jgi:hypothetical protein
MMSENFEAAGRAMGDLHQQQQVQIDPMKTCLLHEQSSSSGRVPGAKLRSSREIRSSHLELLTNGVVC